METNEILNLEIGTEETNVTLTAKPVTIIAIRKEEVGEKKNEKFIFTCKHPDREEPIDISRAKHLVGNTLKAQGTWISLDKDGKLFKNSVVSKMMTSANCLKVSDLVNKVFQTTEDENGYLCFKVY